jgi:hypothetical protein
VYLFLPIMRLTPVLAIVLFAAGCGQKTEPSPSVAPSASPATNAHASTDESQNSPAAAATPDAKAAELAAALAELTQVLRKYSFEHQRLPKSFGEVVAAGYVKDMPQAPPGKKFAIDPKTVQVVLVKQ